MHCDLMRVTLEIRCYTTSHLYVSAFPLRLHAFVAYPLYFWAKFEIFSNFFEFSKHFFVIFNSFLQIYQKHREYPLKIMQKTRNAIGKMWMLFTIATTTIRRACVPHWINIVASKQFHCIIWNVQFSRSRSVTVKASFKTENQTRTNTFNENNVIKKKNEENFLAQKRIKRINKNWFNTKYISIKRRKTRVSIVN